MLSSNYVWVGWLLPCGFANRELREQLAALTGQTPATITQGRMTYDLRRLRLTRHDRKNPQNPLLPSHPVRAPRCAVSSPAPTPASTVPRWPKPRPTALHQVLASATSFKNSKTRSTTTSRRLNSSAENLTQSQQVLKFKSSRLDVGIRPLRATSTYRARPGCGGRMSACVRCRGRAGFEKPP